MNEIRYLSKILVVNKLNFKIMIIIFFNKIRVQNCVYYCQIFFCKNVISKHF